MKTLKKKLTPEQYKLLKEIDFTEIEGDITFDDENCEFTTDSDLFYVIFNEHIVVYGMDEDQNQCTEYGRRLYNLYDTIYYDE